MKRILGILFALVLAVSLMLVPAAPAALAWQEGPSTNWWFIDASYGGWKSSVPLEIELDGDSSAGQTFYVGDTITIAGDIHAYAASCAGYANEAYTEWELEVNGPSGSDSDSGWNYDYSDSCAEVETITTPTITYALTAPGTHTVYMSSYAAVSQYWTDVADDYVDASLTFEVVYEMASFVIDKAKLDFKKSPDNGKVSVKGELALVNGCSVDIGEAVTVTLDSLSQTITMVEKKPGKWQYKRPKGGTGIIKHMKIDWKKGKFNFSMDKADLSGLTDSNDVTISLQVGDDVGQETIAMTVKKDKWDYKAP